MIGGVILLLASFLAAMLAGSVLAVAKSAVHEIEVLLYALMGVLTFVGALLCFYLAAIRDELKRQRPPAPLETGGEFTLSRDASPFTRPVKPR